MVESSYELLKDIHGKVSALHVEVFGVETKKGLSTKVDELAAEQATLRKDTNKRATVVSISVSLVAGIIAGVVQALGVHKQ